MCHCSQIDKLLGRNQQSINEFTIIPQKSLTIPPDYTLLPPKEKRNKEAQKSENDNGRKILNLDKNNPDNILPSKGEIILLQKAKALEISDDVRQKLINEINK